ncbi:MAG: ATP-binding protein [Acidimicrobiales bacterium]
MTVVTAGPLEAASLAHLLAHLELCEARVRRAVESRRAVDPAPDDPHRGLYVGEEHLDWILGSTLPARTVEHDPGEEARLSAAEDAAEAAERAGAVVRLRTLTRTFGLTELDVGILMVALAPDLDQRFERLYGYLNDDVTRRRPSVGLALELCGASPLHARARARLSPAGALLTGGLVQVADTERPMLSRVLVVPDRVSAHLLGDDGPDPNLVDVLVEPPPVTGDGVGLARAFAAGARLAYLHEHPGSPARSMAVEGLRLAGMGAVIIDLGRLAAHEDPGSVVRTVVRDARLVSAGVVAGPVEALVEASPAALSCLANLAWPIVLVGRRVWDPRWSLQVPATLDARVPSEAQRAQLWHDVLGQEAGPGIGQQGAPGAAGTAPAGFDAGNLTSQLVLTPEEVVRSVRAASLEAAISGTTLGPTELLAGARSQNAAGLDRLTRRIEPAVGWDDVVAGPGLLGELRELASRARNRGLVLDEWSMRPGGGRGRGITALFAGPPGTGKTMAAEVIAAELGMDLYSVDLATVVDKYIGETEKNLERIFSEAEGVNGVILFDEADALFGKRSEVSDSHDRHANTEVAYLLQRMESFDGLAILATNLRANLDEAFSRRLDAIVEFAMPEVSERRVLWAACLGASVPQADDLDLDFAAKSFNLAGGSIRSIAVTAAYLSAAAGRPVSMADLMRATHREYRKLGRLIHESEFGPWLEAARR